jgi:hypothetical protein
VPRESLRPEEEWARSFLANALGVSVVAYDDNSRPGMFDLQIAYRDREPGAVEVAAAADPASLALWNELQPAGRWIEPDLAGGWAVGLDRSTDVRQLRRKLPALLRELERRGMRALLDSYPPAPLYERARELGITHAYQSPTTSFPGSVYWTIDLPTEQSGGFVADSTDALSEWVGRFLHDEKRARVRRKLAASGASERHAFIVVVGFSDLDFSVTEPLMRDDPPLPSRRPDLPDEITDVWVASTWSSGSVFHWCEAKDWSKFDKIM